MHKNESLTTAIAKSFASKSFILGWGMVFFYVIFNSFGALTLKNQVQKLGTWNFTTVHSCFSFFFALFSRPQTWSGLGAICIATGAWIVALAHLELSRAYPVAIGLNLLIVVGLSLLYFHEPLTLSKIVGIFLIICGAIALFR